MGLITDSQQRGVKLEEVDARRPASKKRRDGWAPVSQCDYLGTFQFFVFARP